MERSLKQADFQKKTAEFAFKLDECNVSCCGTKSYERYNKELFRPTPEKIREARAWLVQIVARRAVEIFKAHEIQS